jgi:hypothetical protein
MFPLRPLDGGRIAVGVLPKAVSSPLAALELLRNAYPYWLLLLLSLLGAQLGVDLRLASRLIANTTDSIIGVILQLAGNI